jgi:hypothetical protein
MNLNNPDYGKQWNENNLERRTSNAKKWRDNNKEYHQQYTKDKWKTILPGVYMIKCLSNNKCYIGQSKVPYRRQCEHLSKKTDKCTKYNYHIQADLKKYGRKSFFFGIIFPLASTGNFFAYSSVTGPHPAAKASFCFSVVSGNPPPGVDGAAFVLGP